MSAQPQPRLTPEQYLELDRASQTRNEYYNGRMYAMSGGSHRHGIIIGNVYFALRNSLGERPCLITTSDVRVQVRPEGLYTYPDVVVVCGDPRYLDERRDTLLNPLLLIEVLSPTTEAYDRGFKSAQYRMVGSLEEYALVSQTEQRVELYRRQPGEAWLLRESVGLEAFCRLECLGVTISLADIYKNVSLEPQEPPLT